MRAFLLIVLWLYASVAFAAPMVKVGSHPTSVLTAFPRIHSLHAFDGRIYMSYGDWNNYPAVVLVSYDPAANQFRLEHSITSDSVGWFRTVEGRLYASHADPIHYEDFHDFSYLDPTLPAPGWRDQTPVGTLHAFDFMKLGNALYVCGAKDAHEGSAAGPLLMKSTDGGASWNTVSTVSSLYRYYWCFPHGGRVYVHDGFYDGSTFTASSLFNSYSNLYKPTNVGAGNGATEYVVTLTQRVPGIFNSTSSSLARFDGVSFSTVLTNVYDFVCEGVKVYALTASASPNPLLVCDDITVATPVFKALPISGIPSSPSSLEVLNGVLYIGNGSGELWAARIDGSTMSSSPPSILNLLPDQFGRGLAIDGSRLLVGAPDSSGSMPLTGRAELFDEVDTGAWSSAAKFTPPSPKLSGWYGKDVALKGSVLAVVETGYDTTRMDRGSSARVHVYQQMSTGWISRAILTVPFAHTVAIEGNFLFVGTANPAANQVAGQPGVNPYVLRYDGDGALTVAGQLQLLPSTENWGYKPIGRVATSGDLLVAGFSGDVSRDGGKGMISVFKKAPGGSSFLRAPVQEISTVSPDRYAYALAFDGQWLAVGAPRDDTVAPQAGAVYIYENTGAGVPFVLRQKLLTPLAQNEANFGAAVAIKHGVLLIGCPGATVGNTRDAGRVFKYVLTENTWTADGEMDPPVSSLAGFGIEVAIGETTLAAASRFSRGETTVSSRLAVSANPRPFTGFSLWGESLGLPALDPADDSDSDGVRNLEEYVFGLDPRVSDAGTSAFDVPVGKPTIWKGLSTGYDLRYVRPLADARVTVQVETSENLISWSPLAVSPTVLMTNSTHQLCSVPLLPSNSARVFARLRITYNRN